MENTKPTPQDNAKFLSWLIIGVAVGILVAAVVCYELMCWIL